MTLTLRELTRMYAALDDFDASGASEKEFDRLRQAQRTGTSARSIDAAVDAGFHRVFGFDTREDIAAEQLKERHDEVVAELADYDHPRSRNVLKAIELFDASRTPTHSPAFWERYFERQDPDTRKAVQAQRNDVRLATEVPEKPEPSGPSVHKAETPEPADSFTPVQAPPRGRLRAYEWGLLAGYVAVAVLMASGSTLGDPEFPASFVWGSLAISTGFFGLILYRSTKPNAIWWMDVPIIGIFSYSLAIVGLGEAPAALLIFLLFHVAAVFSYTTRPWQGY